MTDKEKLIDLLETIPHAQRLYPDLYVDHLIANGVTVPVLCKDCKDHDRCEVEDLLVKFLCIENAYCAAGERKDNG